ncbi:MAG: hypothetical protein L6R48_10890 [Planctomycetes bacterium]|nr:hypothetical protein [Planctomycetota bacterium]
MAKMTAVNVKGQGFRPGQLITWTEPGPAAGAASLSYLHEPTVVIAGSVDQPIRWAGSMDGKVWGVLRDAEGDPITHRIAGTYVIPHRVCFLRPVDGRGFAGTIHLFVEE